MQSLLGVFVGVDSLWRILCGGSGRFSSAGRRAPGFRERNNGGLVDVGSHGYCWSASVSSIYGRFLWFGTQGLGSCHAHGRAYGLQLRCLSE